MNEDEMSVTGGYKRASRKGAPRRFACEHPGCDKIYSRAEHLQRHQLNHNPKEIFHCDLDGCDQKFVRLDLLARHKKRHSSSYTPRNRIPSFDTSPSFADSQHHNDSHRHSFSRHHGQSLPHDAAVLLTPESHPDAAASKGGAQAQQHQPWPSPGMGDGARADLVPQQQGFYGTNGPSIAEPSALVAFPDVGYDDDPQLAQGNFAAWLFDPQTTYTDFNVANLPFLEGGLESTFNSNIHYDYESLTSLSPMDYTYRQGDASEDWISETRRQEVLSWFHLFRKKQPRFDALMPTLIQESGGDCPALSLDMLRDCLKEFWDIVSPRLPIIHQHTFSPNQCPVFLLMVMLSLGAASLKNRDTACQLGEYGVFADVIINSARWEILTSDDSAPPVQLWAAQALLLVEFYEKLYSSRRLHERANIYHPAFLTLLRRGSPLIGRGGSESPGEPDTGVDTGADSERPTPGVALDSRTWWVRWADTESMHRVVFAAFMLDIIHAAMLGHTADMAAHEIRLPLPCDDNLWAANSPDVVRQLDANFRMYGVKQVSFLDGLKSALHGKEVKTHAFGRMIIISGLLSVGWHLNHRETHLKWLDLRGPQAETNDNWRKLLLRAFDNWKESFDLAMSDSVNDTPGNRPVPNGPINSAALLFHLAHISLHSDIIDCQLYAGARRLLGRKISTRDYTNAVKRMGTWAKQASTRHAILHAFKLLHRVLVDPNPRSRRSPADSPAVQYSVRTETDPHRPWIMYYAVLSIWAFVQAIGRPAGKGFPLDASQTQSTYTRATGYLSAVAALQELDEATVATLHEGLPELLEVMEGILEEADTDVLVEARHRLNVCRDMLLEGR